MVRVCCECGFEDTRPYHTLKQAKDRGDSLRGCLNCKNESQVVDFTGKRFGLLTVLLRDRIDPKNHNAYWKCRCDCGREPVIKADRLVKGATASCGCLVTRTGASHPRWKGHGEISSSQWTHTRRNAVYRDIPFEVTIEEAWDLFLAQRRCCALTGEPLHLRRYRGEFPSASLDRIDSTKGYVLGNVQWVQKQVNLAKRDVPHDDFIQMCIAVAKHHQSVQVRNGARRKTMNNDISAHLNQEFPPHLPEGWVHTMSFAISRETVKVVAAVKSLHLPPHFLVEVPTMFGRAYLDLQGVRHVGRSPYKHKHPPFIGDFNAAVALAESYLDGSLTVGPIVEDETPA